MRRALMEIEGHYVEDRHLEALTAIEAKNRIGLRIAIEADIRDESLLVFPVAGADAGEAFRHPFRFAQ